MLKSKDFHKHDFAYAVGLIRTLENLLLNENEVDRMTLAKNADDAFKILNEFDYADNKAGIENTADFQKVLDEGLVEIKELLEKVTPNKKILDLIWLDYDFHNMKTLLKGKLSGKEYEEVEPLMSKLGTIDIEKLRKLIYEEKYNVELGIYEKGEEYLKMKIEKLYDIFEKGKRNPQIIDLYMDQKLVVLKREIADDSENQFLIKYVKTLIDVNNIRLFFRMKAQEKDQELFEMALIWKGHVDQDRFIKAYKGTLEEFVQSMSVTSYAKLVAEGFKHFEDEHTFIFLEREVENYLTNYIKKAKMIPFGPEPLIAYFLAKKNNALIMRMILINKLNNIEPEEIKTRLRKLYS